MKKFARKCNATGKGMNKGYIFNNGEFYFKFEKDAKAYINSLGLNWNEEKSKFNTSKEWFYFTEWEELDIEQFYDEEGVEYKVCNNCKKDTKVNEDFYFCQNCLKPL